MPSLRKSQSARENGAKSRGPKTKAGKQRSSQNAIRHGLTAQTIVLPCEDPADYQRLLDGYLQHFRPAGQVELDLVHEIAAAKWRLNRLALIETQLLANSIEEIEQDHQDNYEDGDEDEPLTPVQALAKGFENCSGSCSFLYRVQARLERTYFRALKTLLQLQKLRGPSHTPSAPDPNSKNKNCTNEPTNPVPSNAYLALPLPDDSPQSAATGTPPPLDLSPMKSTASESVTSPPESSPAAKSTTSLTIRPASDASTGTRDATSVPQLAAAGGTPASSPQLSPARDARTPARLLQS
ncbi:MAG TPA: hypothetical protein VKX49_04160 [Bryobacteraceae bacterium]|nr:hypothetical protein [Bryobacteraceae bacterium]